MPRTFHSSTRTLKPLNEDRPAKPAPQKPLLKSTVTVEPEPEHKPEKPVHHPAKSAHHHVEPSTPEATPPQHVADQIHVLDAAVSAAHHHPQPGSRRHTHGNVSWVEQPNSALHRADFQTQHPEAKDADPEPQSDSIHTIEPIIPDRRPVEPEVQSTREALDDNHTDNQDAEDSSSDASVKATPEPAKAQPEDADLPILHLSLHHDSEDEPTHPASVDHSSSSKLAEPKPAKEPDVAPEAATTPKSERKIPVVAIPHPDHQSPSPIQEKSAAPAPAKSRRFPVKWITISLITLLVLGGAAAGWQMLSAHSVTPSTASAPSSIQTVTIHGIQGTVERQTTGSWDALQNNDTLKLGDVVRTAAHSRAILNLPDGSTVHLDENSLLAFDRLNNTDIQLDQRDGRSYHQVHSGSSYVVRSLDATVTAHGTAFFVGTSSELNSSSVTVTEHQVTVAAPYLDKDVTVSSGQTASADHTSHTMSVDATSSDILNQDFFTWAMQRPDVSPTPTPTPTITPTPTAIATPTPEPTTDTTISALWMTGTAHQQSVTLNWKLTGSAPSGYRLAMSSNPNPTFPPRAGDQVVTIDSPDARSFTWSGLSSQPYHFRLGVYNGHGGIRWYSNDVTATPLPAPTPTPTPTPQPTAQATGSASL